MAKKGKMRSASFDMNRLSEAIQSMSFYMSFLLYGGCICLMVLILSWFALMPLVEIRQPRTFPFVIPNMHFSGLSFNRALPIFTKVSARSKM
jgi:hypothetical protein